jgi:predicted transcriptional regulator
MDYKSLIKSLTKKQREVFDQICIGNDKSHSLSTLQSLIRKGLIEKYEQQLDVMCSIYRYNFTNYGVHMAWCEVCAEEDTEADEVISKLDQHLEKAFGADVVAPTKYIVKE